MFGLESDKGKKKSEAFVFDLEQELRDVKKQKEILEKIQDRLQQVKTVLRSGESKEEYNRLGTLLHGYTSLLKVITRVKVR